MTVGRHVAQFLYEFASALRSRFLVVPGQFSAPVLVKELEKGHISTVVIGCADQFIAAILQSKLVSELIIFASRISVIGML